MVPDFRGPSVSILYFFLFLAKIMIFTFHYFPIQLGPLGIQYSQRSNLQKIVGINDVINCGDINLYI